MLLVRGTRSFTTLTATHDPLFAPLWFPCGCHRRPHRFDFVPNGRAADRSRVSIGVDVGLWRPKRHNWPRLAHLRSSKTLRIHLVSLASRGSAKRVLLELRSVNVSACLRSMRCSAVCKFVSSADTAVAADLAGDAAKARLHERREPCWSVCCASSTCST